MPSSVENSCFPTIVFSKSSLPVHRKILRPPSSLAKLVKNLSHDDFKYLTKEFGSKNLEHLKQKGAYPNEYMNNFKRFNEEKLPGKECFYRSVKDGKTGENGEKLDGHISDEEYLTCKKFGKNLA